MTALAIARSIRTLREGSHGFHQREFFPPSPTPTPNPPPRVYTPFFGADGMSSFHFEPSDTCQTHYLWPCQFYMRCSGKSHLTANQYWDQRQQRERKEDEAVDYKGIKNVTLLSSP